MNKYFCVLATGPAMRYRLNSGLYFVSVLLFAAIHTVSSIE
jgi:hypothetical protein